MNQPSENLVAYAVLGKQLEEFWASDVGRYLRGRAKNAYTAAVNELMTCDPTDARAVIKARGACWQAEMFERWVNEGIEAGLNAQIALMVEEEPDVNTEI